MFFKKRKKEIDLGNNNHSRWSHSRWPHQNLHLEKKENIFENITYLSSMAYEDEKLKKSIFKKCNYFLKNEYIETNRLWLGSYYLKEINELKIPYKLEIKKVSDFIGYGVYANEDIGAFKFIGEYVGILRKRRKKVIKGNYYCLRYSIEDFSEKKYVIDAKDYGNHTRFINHSNKPNCEIKTAFVDNIMHMIVVTSDSIKKDQQLTIDYGSLFWNQLKMLPIPI
jgi:uncharacterized protein